MTLREIEEAAKTKGFEALGLIERQIARERGWLDAWCAQCGRKLDPKRARHFKRGLSGRRAICNGTITYYKPKDL